ncbi:MAG: glucose 1-dehydrogenase [Hyphomonas sp.]|uniref:SDR family NAD(P)-dependent oxidoreductase n=1 Tax=Hyphomonas sp. TaxID=87 RepID=UPI0035296F04
MGLLEGRVALVTGAGSGIGRAAALALAAEGAAVVITDIDAEGLAGTAATIGEAGGKALPLAQDVTDEAAWETVFDTAGDELGPVTVLVNNAGIAVGGAIIDLTLADWQRQMRVNVDSVFLGTRAAIQRMKDTGGSIINLSSVAGLRGSAGLSAYCTSKGAVRLFTKSAAVECAQAGWNIRINSVHPGIIDTPIWQKSITAATDSMPADMAAALKPEGSNAMNVNVLAAGVAPMGRPGRPGEIADMIVFLASDRSSYATGQEFIVDGGMTAR